MQFQHIKRLVNRPIFSKKIDPFIVVALSIFGAFIGASTPFSIWKTLLIGVPLVMILIAILSILGAKWRKKKGIKEEGNL